MGLSEIAPSVDAVVFDVGRVLFRWDLDFLYRDLIPDTDERRWFITHVVTEQWHFRHDAGEVLDALVTERIALFPHHEALIREYATGFGKSIPGPVPGSLELVRALNARAVPLFAITNFAAPFWAEFRAREPVFDLFGDIVVSGVEKLAKPDPAIFALAALRFGYDPRRMLFIDDSAANVAAAGAGGWQVHHFTDAASLEADLRARALIV